MNDGATFARRVGDYLKTLGHELQPEYAVAVGLNRGYKKSHRFDLGNDRMLVECKHYDWTVGGNVPSAKMAILNEAMMYFAAAPSKYTKHLFIAETSVRGTRFTETLGERYIRMYRHLIPDDVEVWEFDHLRMAARRLCGT